MTIIWVLSLWLSFNVGFVIGTLWGSRGWERRVRRAVQP